MNQRSMLRFSYLLIEIKKIPLQKVLFFIRVFFNYKFNVYYENSVYIKVSTKIES